MKKLLLSAIMMAASLGCAWAQGSALEQLTIVDGVAQIANDADMTNFALAVAEGNNELNAVLTADIPNYTGDVIATSSNRYKGTFDGQYHTIIVNLTSTDQNYGLFRALEGTIRNLHVGGVFIAQHNRVGVICGEIFGGTIENCWSSADIQALVGGDGCVSGICGRASAAGSLIKNCVYSGNVNSGTSETYNCAGIVGWCANPIDIQNCIVTGVFETNQLQGNARPIARYDSANNTNANCLNCFFVHPNGTDTNINTTQVSEEMVTSGELGYQMNGDQSQITWTQTLDTDAVPVPFPTHQTIYADGNLNCVGQSLDGSSLTYSNTKTKDLPPHNYVEGICTMCGKADPSMATLVDGYYLISTPDQLLWFAAKVNGGDVTANGKLTEDITLGEYNESFQTIGTNANRFAGIFDGQFHTITINLTAKNSSYGFFSYLAGTVKNLHIDGYLDAAFNKVGVFAGEMFGATIENCWSSVEIAATYAGDGAIAGIAGRSSADGNTIRNCAFTGNVKGVAWNCSGIVGWCANLINIQNCLVTGTFDTDQTQGNARPIARHDTANSNGNCVNCYYVNPNGTLENINTKQVTVEQLQSGEVALLLNGDSSPANWFQFIGVDETPTPMPESGVVYKINKVYGNAFDNESFENFKNTVINTESEYAQSVVAQTILASEYDAAINNSLTGNNIDELLAAWAEIEPLYQQVVESEKAYAAYQAKVEEVIADLDKNESLQNVKRDNLEYYLKEFSEPDTNYPNGTATYIMEERLLSTEEIVAETSKIDAMYNEAITYEPASGTDVTKLLTNPDFSDGFNGWEGKVGTQTGTSSTSPVRAAECYNATMDMTQTLTGLQNGIYELQVNGAFRPYPGAEDLYNTNYAATLSANGVHNYFMTLIEDMLPVGEDIDGYNCDHSSDWPDYEVRDLNEEVVGYVVHGLPGCCNAFQVNRYFNTVLCEVTDGTLTVGIHQPGTGQQPEWLGFGNLKLIYHGTMEESGEALARVLQSQADRATTIVDSYEFSSGVDYATYPNFSQELKDQLKAAIAAAKTTKDLNAMYELVETFSDLFLQVYECKKAYIGLMDQADRCNIMEAEMYELFTTDQIRELENLMEKLITMFEEGSASTEVAQKDYMSELSFLIKQVDGIYQISSPLEFVQFASLVNGGQNAINGVLTADINMDGLESSFKAIGSNTSSATYYAGTFDGQYHTINLNWSTPDQNYGIFRALSGTVKNLHVSGTLEALNTRTGAIVGESFSGTIENCWSSVDITTNVNNNATAGILGRSSADGTIVRNCIYTGNINGGANASNCAGIIGYSANTSTVTNCVVTGTIVTGLKDNGYIIARNAGSATCVNCYYVTPYENRNDGATQITEEQVASGELCFLLNGDQKMIQWTQTIAESKTPVPFQNQSIVYIQGNLNCDGISLIDGEASYANTPCTTIAPHTFVDGVCAVCGAADTGMAQEIDGYYQLGTPEQLLWFIAKVNGGENTLNAQLTDDIDLTDYAEKFVPAGNSNLHYAGIFDGQYHTITVNMEATASSYGFFRYLDGTVKNLHIDGNLNAAFNKVGVIAGEMFGATIENCWSSVEIAATYNGDGAIAGIAGRSSANGNTIRNCAFTGNVKGVAWNCSGIVGWCANLINIQNCLVTGTFDTDQSQGNARPIARHDTANSNGNCENCYYVNPNGTLENINTKQVTLEQLQSGEICYLLNGDQSTIQWHQNLSEETYPTPFPGATVLKNENGEYYNGEDAIETIADENTKPAAIYNMMGQKVEKPQKGIYIINGKKVLFK